MQSAIITCFGKPKLLDITPFPPGKNEDREYSFGPSQIGEKEDSPEREETNPEPTHPLDPKVNPEEARTEHRATER
jgi:hypothetical protein